MTAIAVAAAPALREPRAERRAGPAPDRGTSSSSAQDVGDKARKHQQNSASMVAKRGRLQMHRARCRRGRTRAQSRSRSPRPDRRSSSTPDDRGGENRGDRPEPADQAATRMKATSSAAGSSKSPIKAHFTKDIGRNSWSLRRSALLAPRFGIVYGPLDATTCAGRWPAPASGSVAVACLHINAGTGRLPSQICYSAACPLVLRFRRHGCQEHARRVRYLHHHLSGAGGVHLPAPAQRARPAHRPRAAAL